MSPPYLKRFHGLTGTVRETARMVRPILLGLAAVLTASAALAAPLKLPGAAPADAHRVLADGFMPFDQAAGDGWTQVTREPVYLSAGITTPASTTFDLKPGSYRVVVLCDCTAMEVTLLQPDATTLPAERKDDRRAMYSFDVPAAGAYLTGIDMDACNQTLCAIGVKVYRKISD
jgi:hypothetical protein